MSRRGFTLVEVLLVVLIMTILSVAGFSGLIRLQKTAKASEIKSKIVNFLSLARSYAINGKTVKSCFNNPNGIPRKYAVQIDTNAKKLFLFSDQMDPQDVLQECEKMDEYLDFGNMVVSMKDGSSGSYIYSATLFFDPTYATFSMIPKPVNSEVLISIYSNSTDATPLQIISFSSQLGIPE